MNKFIRYWNVNRKKIIITIVIIAFLFILLNVLNTLYKQSINKSTNIPSDVKNPTQSVMTGQTITKEESTQNTNYIKDFVEACNNKKYEEAYALLSEDCKKEIFNNEINKFINNYCNTIFNNKKTYQLELWNTSNISYTYKIKYYEDNLLATGGSNLNKNFEDYITIIEQGNENKVNINGFIGIEEIKKSKKENDVEIVINKRKKYMDYESYEITIKNYTNQTIQINNGENNKDICLVDSKDVQYSSYISEIPVNQLVLNSKYEKKIQIRFNKIYTVKRTIEKIEFKNIILNQAEYLKDKNSSNIQKINISIDI